MIERAVANAYLSLEDNKPQRPLRTQRVIGKEVAVEIERVLLRQSVMLARLASALLNLLLLFLCGLCVLCG